MKPCFAVFNAWLLSIWINNSNSKSWILSIVLLSTILTILLLQPDVGMSFILASTWMFQIYIAGISLYLVCFTLFIISIIGFSSYFLFDHVQKRVDGFLEGGGFQIGKSIDAFLNGKPIITYYYTPTSLMGKPEIDMVRLSEPSYDKACWDSMMVVVDNIKIYGTNAYESSCANEYKNMALTKLATGNFYNNNSNIISFANAYTITTSVVNNLLAYYVDISNNNLL